MSRVTDKFIRVLTEKKRVITKAFFWKIPHDSGRLDIRLKVGGYKKPDDPFEPEIPEDANPKSEITFDEDEFKALIAFLQENYEPFKQGFKAFIPIDRPFTEENAEQVRKLFSVPKKARLISFVSEQNLIPEDLSIALENIRRTMVIHEFQLMLEQDLVESDWQKWFEVNTWVLGSEFVRVLNERHIDVENISDFLMQAYNGFLDVVEIKQPGGDYAFGRRVAIMVT
ncbi:MAG: Shedu anti-phage system protein SduA domain-containing protein [Candidatus Thiodiazotropha sp.]